jgi:hypothetical protein
LFTITGRLGRAYASSHLAWLPTALRRPPRMVVGLLAAVLLAGTGAVLWLVSGPEAPRYSDTLIVSLCGSAPPRNSERCHQPIGDTDKLLLVDFIRRYGGSTRQYERDGVVYVEVKAAVTGGGPRLAELILGRDGVDAVESP